MFIKDLSISNLKLVEQHAFTDQRGFFSRLFCDNELSSILENRQIVQINHSRTLNIGTVRGLHYQIPPFAEMKFIKCIKGRVLDVVVDVRSGSSTFLQWHAEELCSNDQKIFVIPEGFAHGFQVLEAGSELLYLHTARYQPDHEAGIAYNDPTVGIDWPLPEVDLSFRDKSHPFVTDQFKGIRL